ncbi:MULTISPECIES: type 1 glutamine amidotransferase [unclassified Bosea (in: a-proteobacteria)]|uniref:type 1 glutamine amidotransferase n=1 Tax=unclassified Bosea (in: a-proteobacteria) TaxID=2653178 RepID=UPI00095687C6|nr:MULTISPECIES: type 1 glutamine amidotransferase [unclassified Bosea (in: a-proteobacteria)]TAJ33815.1 MAG: type 1 glutamine amidotransferase [Bosea sp. (in: a-proteobacteria)]SIR60024.1 GMP synthase-Glutamine amidotransferase [Bosea sp. TND4EK4]
MGGKLLLLQNGPKRDGVARLPERFAGWGLDVDARWAYAGDFPDTLAGYDGIFVTGSPHGAYEDIPFIHREHDLIREADSLGIPMLGVCFGSQILASALCGRDQVFRRPFCEVGNKWLDVTPAARGDEIAGEIGERVYMFVWHNDEVRADHPDMRIIATSDLCPNQIWRFRDHRVWGIQGHPEVTKEQAVVWFEQSRATMERDGADIDALKATADEALPAKTMLSKFAALCGATAA